MAEETGIIEQVTTPLTRSSSIINGTTNSGSSNASLVEPQQQKTTSLYVLCWCKQLSFSLLFAITGLFGPKYLLPMYLNADILQKNIPYQKTTSGDVILDFELNKPLVYPPTVPGSLLMMISIWMPTMIIILFGLYDNFCASTSNTSNNKFNKSKRQKLYSMHYIDDFFSALCGLCLAVGLSEGITQILKIYVMRKRPNFYALCDFDVQTLKCNGPIEHVLEAQLSFPSGHSSLSFCGMTFLALYLCGKVALLSPSSSSSSLPLVGNHNGASSSSSVTGSSATTTTSIATASSSLQWKRILFLICFFAPLSVSTVCALSRIVDTWHHPSDILAGIALGSLCATIAYHVYYPSILSTNGIAGIPLSGIASTGAQLSPQDLKGRHAT